MMKSIILSIGLISAINASSQRILNQATCATVRCASGTFCTEDPIAGVQCVSCAATTCPTGQSCEEGIGCTCGSFEEYNTCGSACPPVCGDSSIGACIAVCVEGCFCQDGYIRDSNGRCISENECIASGCGANEVFSPCNGHCRPTCETGPNIICTLQCQPGCNCAEGYTLDQADGTCIPEGDCPSASSSECPLRCENGFDGCNDCFCDGLGNTGGCTKRGCPNGNTAPAACTNCEVGYTLNTLTNECESAKVSCTNNGDCNAPFKCRKDPECRAYSDLACANTGKVCVTGSRSDVCTSDSECDQANGFACLDGDNSNGNGRCVKYQS